mmetsp:Transcript_10865/g.35721  ORF Transcript_10865/g.35721 Transcript_10865/m.35721 type:complete len:206 (+) Transcript_10865:131-748(+)
MPQVAFAVPFWLTSAYEWRFSRLKTVSGSAPIFWSASATCSQAPSPPQTGVRMTAARTKSPSGTASMKFAILVACPATALLLYLQVSMRVEVTTAGLAPTESGAARCTRLKPRPGVARFAMGSPLRWKEAMSPESSPADLTVKPHMLTVSAAIVSAVHVGTAAAQLPSSSSSRLMEILTPTVWSLTSSPSTRLQTAVSPLTATSA